MGIFTTKDRYGETRPRVSALVGAGVGALTLLFAAASSFYINTERQTSLEVLFGRVIDSETTPGWKWKNILSSRFAYSLARQATEVSEATNIRTEDDLRLSGRYHIEYEVDEAADVQKLYYDLKDQGGDLDNVVRNRAEDAAVRAIESLSIDDIMPIDAADQTAGAPAQSLTDMITTGVQDRLQARLTEEGWPVRIIGVYSTGFNFSQDSEARIAEIVGIRAERVKLDLRADNAARAREVYEAEAQADAAYINALRTGAGLQDEDVAQALCMKMNRDAGRVNEPFAAGCNGNPADVAVTVPARTPAP